MTDTVEPLSHRQHVDELRATWQARVLAAATTGVMRVVVPSILAHAYDEFMPTLMRAIDPPCWDASRLSLRVPFLTSIGRINRRGQIVANAMMSADALPTRDKVVFASTTHFQYELRKLADATRLTDAEREQFFIVAKKWLAADQRLDPAMDPQDPDAKRLVAH